LGHQRDEWQKPDEVIVKKRIVAEVTRYKKFEASLLGQDINFEVGDIDIKRYIKFLLKDGNIEEKREIISYFEGRVTLKQKRIELEVAR
jgi:hypothetical protein